MMPVRPSTRSRGRDPPPLRSRSTTWRSARPSSSSPTRPSGPRRSTRISARSALPAPAAIRSARPSRTRMRTLTSRSRPSASTPSGRCSAVDAASSRRRPARSPSARRSRSARARASLSRSGAGPRTPWPNSTDAWGRWDSTAPTRCVKSGTTRSAAGSWICSRSDIRRRCGSNSGATTWSRCAASTRSPSVRPKPCRAWMSCRSRFGAPKRRAMSSGAPCSRRCLRRRSL